jgi:hypothetical protein
MIEEETLFNLDEFTEWRKEWQDMPEFVQKNLMPYRTLYIHFENEEDIAEFGKLIESNITADTKFFWFPRQEKRVLKNKRYIDES